MAKDRPDRRNIRLPQSAYARQGQVFSVTVCTAPRQDVFSDLGFGKECLSILESLSKEKSNPVWAFCLMPDHVHLLVGVSPGAPLSGFVGSWKSLCYQARRSRDRPERFWQRGYFDRGLRASTALENAALYILNNPVRAGIVEDWRDYELSGSFELSLSGS